MKSLLFSISVWVIIWIISCFVTWGFVDISEFSNQGRLGIVLGVGSFWVLGLLFDLDDDWWL